MSIWYHPEENEIGLWICNAVLRGRLGLFLVRNASAFADLEDIKASGWELIGFL